jgi:hypothetical protein
MDSMRLQSIYVDCVEYFVDFNRDSRFCTDRLAAELSAVSQRFPRTKERSLVECHWDGSMSFGHDNGLQRAPPKTCRSNPTPRICGDGPNSGAGNRIDFMRRQHLGSVKRGDKQ